jgi:hypothetical protein
MTLAALWDRARAAVIPALSRGRRRLAGPAAARPPKLLVSVAACPRGRRSGTSADCGRPHQHGCFRQVSHGLLPGRPRCLRRRVAPSCAVLPRDREWVLEIAKVIHLQQQRLAAPVDRGSGFWGLLPRLAAGDEQTRDPVDDRKATADQERVEVLPAAGYGAATSEPAIATPRRRAEVGDAARDAGPHFVVCADPVCPGGQRI